MAMQGPNDANEVTDVKEETASSSSEASSSVPSPISEDLMSSTIDFQPPKYTSGFMRFFGAGPSEAEVQQAKELFKYEKEAKRLAEEWQAQHPTLSAEEAAALKQKKARERTEFDGGSIDKSSDIVEQLSIMLAEKASMRDVAIEARTQLGLGIPPVQGPELQPQPSAMSQFGPENKSASTQLFHAKLQQGLQTRLNAKLSHNQVSKLDLDDRTAVSTFKKVAGI